MRILFTDMIGFMKDNYNIQTEIIKNHVHGGDEVFVLNCSEGIENGCGTALAKSKKRCAYCRFNRTVTLNNLKLTRDIKEIKVKLDKDMETTWEKDFSISSIDELKTIEYDGFDVGMAIASEIISYFRNPKPVLSEDIIRRVKLQLRELELFKVFLENTIKKYKIEKVFLFNGRLPFQRVALRVVRQNNIEVSTFEKSFLIKRYRMYEGTFPHDLEYNKGLIDILWKNTDNVKMKEQWAEEYYGQLEHNSKNVRRGFTDNQNPELDIISDPGIINVGIFVSSEDEFEAINDQWKLKNYKNQNDAIRQLIEYNWRGKVHFYVRVHPNLINVKNNQTDYLYSIDSEGFTVIAADSQVSSYRLMRECDIMIVFGSSIGIEACYNRKAVILLGRAIYEDLPGIIKPESHSELCEFILNYRKGGAPTGELARESAVRYAWFCKESGTEFSYFYQVDRRTIIPKESAFIWGKLDRLSQQMIYKFANGTRLIRKSLK